jgi:hypothetical protein
MVNSLGSSVVQKVFPSYKINRVLQDFVFYFIFYVVSTDSKNTF